MQYFLSGLHCHRNYSNLCPINQTRSVTRLPTGRWERVLAVSHFLSYVSILISVLPQPNTNSNQIFSTFLLYSKANHSVPQQSQQQHFVLTHLNVNIFPKVKCDDLETGKECPAKMVKAQKTRIWVISNIWQTGIPQRTQTARHLK